MSQETKNVQATFPSGNKYKGEWSDGQANGHGIMTFPNMDKYDGEFDETEYEQMMQQNSGSRLGGFDDFATGFNNAIHGGDREKNIRSINERSGKNEEIRQYILFVACNPKACERMIL